MFRNEQCINFVVRADSTLDPRAYIESVRWQQRQADKLALHQSPVKPQALSTRTDVASALGIYQATISIRVVVALNAVLNAQYPVQEHRSTRGRPWTPCHGRDTLRLFETTSRSSESAIETSAMTADRSANCTLLRIRALEKVAGGGPHCSWRLFVVDGVDRRKGPRAPTAHIIITVHTQRVGRSPRGAIVHAIAQSTPPQRRRSWRAHLDHRPPIFELAVLVHLNRLKSIWRLR